MNTFRYPWVGALVLAFTLAAFTTGCDTLDKEPLDQISEEAVYEDPNLVDNYVLDTYDALNLQQGYGFNSFMSWRWDAMSAELVTGASWQYHLAAALSVPDQGGTHWAISRWPYGNIRRTNTIIEKLRNSDLSQDFIETRVAEARFVRAMAYFRLVKRYGGVPLIKKAQSVDAPRDSVFVPRSSEREVYDFISAELDAAAQNLPQSHEGWEGRASMPVAYALKSRAMLYAASVAEFGDMQTAGSGENSVQLGIPASEADQYWQQALDASEEVINSGQFSLFEQFNDPATNYQRLFLTGMTENDEVIFGEAFDGEEKGHSNTYQNLPMEWARGWGANAGATWETVQLFNYQDGSSGEISDSQLEGQMWSAEELFGNRDPRFKGSVLYPQSTFRGERITFHSSTIDPNGDEVSEGTVGDGWPASAPPRNITNTGLLVKKRTARDQRPTSHGTDDTDYIEFRLGEMYMNAAEAAYELGEMDKVETYINRIRNRADMPTFSQSELSREVVRDERQRELVLEQHRYWDLRRWRIAHEVLDGKRVKGLRFTYHYNEDEYDVRLVNAESSARTFQERHYYLPLGSSRISSNPALVENPGY